MAVLKNSGRSSLYLSSIFSSLIAGAIGWGLLLISTASSLSQSSGSQVGKIGPLQLFEISKNVLPDGGYEGGFSFIATGAAIYLGVVIVVGLILGWLRGRNASYL